MHSDFTQSCLAQEMEARHCICAVVARLKDLGLAPERAGDVELVLAEAINNIVEHAYAGGDPGEVRVQAALSDDSLVIRLSDDGAALPEERIPAARLPDADGDLDDLPEGGFGWFLIRSLTSAVRYERSEGSNQLALFFKIDSDELPGLSHSVSA